MPVCDSTVSECGPKATHVHILDLLMHELQMLNAEKRQAGDDITHSIVELEKNSLTTIYS